MPISEERMQLLLPRRLKAAAQRRAKRLGLSVGHYLRQLIEGDVRNADRQGAGVPFPFGERPMSTGRTRGSIDHDRLE